MEETKAQTFLNFARPERLADCTARYASGLARPAGDPLGVRGLPEFRVGLNSLAESLCGRLHSAGVIGIASGQIVAELGLRDCRALRLLVAYCRVWGGVHQIVGVPGDRYYWGDAKPEMYQRVIRDCTRRGRCYLFIASLHKRQGTAMAAAQMMFDFIRPAADGDADDLAAMMALEGVRPADVASSFIELMAATDEGRAQLAELGARHASLLVPAKIRDQMLETIETLKRQLIGLPQAG